MNLYEYIGLSLVIFLCAVGATVVARCAWIGGKQLWKQAAADKRERQAQAEFERKVGLGL